MEFSSWTESDFTILLFFRWVTVLASLVSASISLGVELQMKVLKAFPITEKGPTRAFSWLKAPTSTFTVTLKTWALTHGKQVDVNLGC